MRRLFILSPDTSVGTQNPIIGFIKEILLRRSPSDTSFRMSEANHFLFSSHSFTNSIIIDITGRAISKPINPKK
jgi:hypothetical protein